MGLIDCQKADGLLIELLYAELDDAKARSVREHMSSCTHCEAVFAELSATASLAAKLPEKEPSAQLSYDILREARKAVSPTTGQQPFYSLARFLLRPAFGSAFLLCLISATLFLFREAGIDRPTVEQTEKAMKAADPESLGAPSAGKASPVPELPAAPGSATPSPSSAEPPSTDAPPQKKREFAAPALGRSPFQSEEKEATGIKKGGGGRTTSEERPNSAASAQRSTTIRRQPRRLAPAARSKLQKPGPQQRVESGATGSSRPKAKTSKDTKDKYIKDLLSQDAVAPAEVSAGAAPSMGAMGDVDRGYASSPQPRRKAAKRRATRPSMSAMDDAPPPAPSPAPMASAAPEDEAALAVTEGDSERAPSLASRAPSMKAAARAEIPSPRQRLATAKALLERGEARRADQSLRGLLKTLPGQDVLASETRHQLGRAQLAQKQVGPALGTLRAAFNDKRYAGREAAKQDLLRGLEMAAVEAERAGRSREAIRHWEEIARLDPRQVAKAARATRRLQTPAAPSEVAPAGVETAPMSQ